MKISKKAGIAIFLAVALLMALIIVLHQNPGADPQEELWKKIISCGVIAGSCVIFVRWYDKFTQLPELILHKTNGEFDNKLFIVDASLCVDDNDPYQQYICEFKDAAISNSKLIYNVGNFEVYYR